MVEDHGDRFVVPDCFALSLLSCSSVLMVLFGCVVVLVSIRSVGSSLVLLSVFSPLAARTVTIYGYQTRYQPRSAKSSCFSRRRSAPCRGNRVIVRLLHSGFVRLCWLWGIGERLCPEVLDRDLGLMWNWNAA